MKWFKWPRGRYNGQRIVGFNLLFRVNLCWFSWKPVFPKYSRSVIWLWFLVGYEFEYEW